MKPKNAEELIKGIDFSMLKEQKKVLLILIEDNNNVLVVEKLEGIIGLIDEVQDYAVDVLGFDENLVFDLHPDGEEQEFDVQGEVQKSDFDDRECTTTTPTPKPSYFELVHIGYQKELQREEIQIHAGENGNVFLIKTSEGFIVDVYGQNDIVDSQVIFEDNLIGNVEDNLPESISDAEILNFKEEWGQSHSEICSALGYSKKHSESDDLLMLDFFWIKADRTWYNKNASMFTPREQQIADYLRTMKIL